MAGDRTRARTALAGTRPRSAPPAVRALLLAGAGPAIWFAHLNASYLLVPPSCSWRHRWAFAAATASALAAIALASRRSWAAWRQQPRDALTLVRFLGISGVVLSALFALTTLLVGASVLVIEPCR